MELSERIIATLESEGFATVSEESLPAHTSLPTRIATTPTTFVVTDGSIEVRNNKTSNILESGNRFDVPADTPYTIVAGKSGCNYVVGEF